MTVLREMFVGHYPCHDNPVCHTPKCGGSYWGYRTPRWDNLYRQDVKCLEESSRVDSVFPNRIVSRGSG